MNAEAAYLFRHAVMRDAAYQLHMPGARAKLHGLVLAILEDLFAGDPGMLDANAAEMADHARDALLGAHDGHDAAALRAISAKELEYCRRAAGVARRTFQIDESVRLCVRVAAHPLASHEVAALALSDAAEVRHESGASALGESLARQAVERAQAARHAHAQSRAKSALGRCLQGLARQGESQLALDEAIAHARERGDTKLLASALFLRARVYDSYSQTEAMHALLAEADVLMAKNGDLAGRAEIMMLLAATEHRRTLETERCLAQGLAALELMKRSGSIDREGALLHSLGVICADAGRTDQAEGYYRRALEIFVQTGSRPKQAMITHNLAQLDLFFRHRYQAALRGYELALQENREMGLPGPESSEAATIAGMWRRLGQPHKALPYSLRAHELMSRADSGGGLANATGYLGETLLALGRYDEAEQKLRYAIGWHQQNNSDPETLADFHESLAVVLRRTGRLEAAMQHLEQAERLLEVVKFKGAARLLRFERGLLQLDAQRPGSVAAQAIGEAWHSTPPLEKMGPKPRLVRRILPALRACLVGLGEFTPACLPELFKLAEEAASFGELRTAVDVGPVLENLKKGAAELEQAGKEGRKPRLFGGFLPEEMTPPLRLALLERLKTRKPEEYAELERTNAALLEQMREGTAKLEIPHWEKREEP